MGKLIYLNPDLPVRLCTVPASAVVKLLFADGRANYVWPIEDYFNAALTSDTSDNQHSGLRILASQTIDFP